MNIRKHNIPLISCAKAMCSRTAALAIAACLAAAASTTVGAQTFSHYLGHANAAYDQRGMQQVHEMHYYYYVDADCNPFAINLPIENYNANGSDCEPRNYFRWYDYNTDRSSSRLTKQGSIVQEISDATGTSRGLFAINLPSNGNLNPTQSTVGVMYNPPAEAKNENWEGDIIACDISRYNDFNGTGGTMTAEPTLSLRCIFHIMSGKKMAQNIINTTATDIRGRYSDLTIEDNRSVTVGLKDSNARISLRTNAPVDRYCFYAMTNSTHHVYSADEAHEIKSADFDKSTLYKSAGILWRAYDKTKTKYTNLYSFSNTQIKQFERLLIQNNGNGWRTLDGKSTTKPTIETGDVVYLVAYATTKQNGPSAPIANFELVFQDTYPKSTEQIYADGDNDRTVAYLDAHYKQAMNPISFDDDNDDMDVAAPTTPDNNASSRPSKWASRTYSFTYHELKDFCPKGYYWQPYTPVHGEYGLYKSANVKGISDYNSGYRWWVSDVAYDRTYERTGGKQYGHFMYIDASDESRQIAAADFKANLCSGAQLIFSGAVADFTSGGIKPEVMFRVYGIITDDNGKVTDQRLITSFSSGDFRKNTTNLTAGKWMQVFGRVVLPRNSGAENYSDFRIVIDNMCGGTKGADYLIDDLRLYLLPAKMNVTQNKPVCPNEAGYTETPDDITLKISTLYENMHAIVGNTSNKIYYRFCTTDGTPVSGIDYNGDGQPDEYGEAEVPDKFDATKMLPSYAAGGSTTTPMFERNAENYEILVLANRNFNLPLGQKYYVSVAYPDDNDPDTPGVWGVSTNTCSTYSEDFEIVQQNVLITDANGNVVTTVRVSCDDNRTPNVQINGKLETADTNNGGKVTLSSVKFDWFLSMPNEENNFTKIDGLQDALYKYRQSNPNATELVSWYQYTDAEGYALLKKYIDNGQLVLAASNNLNDHKFGHGLMGTYKIAAIPIATTVTEGKTVYEICPDPMYFTLRVVEDGPKMTLGFGDVAYPTDDRAVRIGLPQIRSMLAKGKGLTLPVASLESTQKVKFENGAKVFIADTNDPTWDNSKQIVGQISNDGLTNGESTLTIMFNDDVADIMHEGYWYELNFSFRQDRVGTEAVVSCPGETFITFKVVPEYLTWNSNAENKLNSNWNNDLNWMRSTAAQIYKADYTDYATATYNGNDVNTRLTRQKSYTPMKFSKVTIDDQTGKVYPDLGNIVYRQSNKIATKLTNVKSEEATSGIAYDIVVKWNYNTADGSDTGDGSFTCEKFEGNLCDEIYLKPHAELLDPCYLVYRKAYAEKEMEPRKWYLMSSPLRATYAGDMYVPKDNGRQETEAFRQVSFDNTTNSRTLYPVYQRNWDHSAQQIVDGLNYYEADDYDGQQFRIDTISDQSLNIESLYWSHVYNKLDEAYDEGRGFALKAGDHYTAATANTLIRLPKADTRYHYFNADGTESATAADVDKTQAYRMLVEPSTAASYNSPISQTLQTNTHSANGYYIIGNPYTCSLSASKFLQGNTAFANKVWLLEADRLTGYTLPTDGTYDRQKDVLIEPMQAFFVKLKDGESAPATAYFTTRMTVDRWLVGGANVKASEAALTLNAATDGNSHSQARIVVSPEAESGFSDDEDVELLANNDLDDIAQVYTVAGSEAVTANRTDRIDWMPLGIVAKESRQAEITFGKSRALDTDLYLFDSATRTFTPIADGTTAMVETNAHGRYFITRQSSLAGDHTTTGINCYSPSPSLVVVTSPTERISRVTIYDANGSVVASSSDAGGTSCQLSVSQSGLLIVKATTADGLTMTKKIAVRQ